MWKARSSILFDACLDSDRSTVRSIRRWSYEWVNNLTIRNFCSREVLKARDIYISSFEFCCLQLDTTWDGWVPARNETCLRSVSNLDQHMSPTSVSNCRLRAIATITCMYCWGYGASSIIGTTGLLNPMRISPNGWCVVKARLATVIVVVVIVVVAAGSSTAVGHCPALNHGSALTPFARPSKKQTYWLRMASIETSTATTVGARCDASGSIKRSCYSKGLTAKSKSRHEDMKILALKSKWAIKVVSAAAAAATSFTIAESVCGKKVRRQAKKSNE